MWMMIRGALACEVTCTHQTSFLPSMCPIVSMIFEAGADEERELIRSRDWIRMIHYGVTFFMLEKLGAVTGVGYIHIYAAMTGLSVEDFQKTCSLAITFGVAGKS
jgi:Aromatic-ring-opening dioxygenase LigAB, LigA subunit